MNQTNYDFLCNDLKFLGFAEGLQPALRDALETEHLSFELEFRNKIEEGTVAATLFFTRSDPEGYFFFSRYEMRLNEKRHLFFIFKGKGVTVKEGFNLLNGRAVFKQRKAKNGQTYNEWIELDLNVPEENGFKVITYSESYGFELSPLIDSMQIDTPSANWDRAMLIRSLERGNLQPAFLRQDDKNRKVLLSANPRERSITVHELGSVARVSTEETKTGDDIEDALNRKTSRAKRLKDITH